MYLSRILTCAICLLSQLAFAQSNPERVTLAGSFQAVLGCDADWSPACATTELTYQSSDDIWMGTFSLPAGSYEYKAALNGSWDENYGRNAGFNGENIALNLTAAKDVTFFYDHKSHWITDNVNSVIATAPGSYQAEIGCPDDWRPECMRSWLQDPDGDGTYVYVTPVPAGSYECKVAINRNWTENYGTNGDLDGANIGFGVGNSEAVRFSYNSTSHLLSITTEVVVSSNAVTLVGSLQSELGCSDDWQPDCANTHLTYDSEDQAWQASFTLPAGDYQYKVALNNSWDVSYGQGGALGGENLNLSLAAETPVKFYYSTASNWVTDNHSSVIATLAGNLQKALGCAQDWDPACLRTWLQDLDGDGIYTLTTSALPFGLYECKVAINESWDENYGANGVLGGDNISFLVPSNNAPTSFSYNASTHLLTVTSAGEPPPAPVSAAYAIIHYQRADGDYGDPSGGDYHNYWGLHLWGEAVDPSDTTQWDAPKPFLGQTEFGRFAFIKLSGKPGPINFIVHRGDVKDGGDADRSFDPATQGSYTISIKSDDPSSYGSPTAAQGFATIHYHRSDGNYGTDTDQYWGLHLWSDGGANAIDPAIETDWATPRPADGVDAFGAFWHLPLNPADPHAAEKPIMFIVHQPAGDTTGPGGDREPGGNRQFIPAEQDSAWLVEQSESVYPTQGAASGFATLHYHRPAGDYGDYSADYTQFWGMHNWDGAANPAPGWDQPVQPVGFDSFGAIFKVDLVEGATALSYILHKGDEKDPGPDQSLNLIQVGHEAWQIQSANLEVPYVFPILAAEPGGVNPGNLGLATAYWLTRNTLLWSAVDESDATYQLHYAPNGGLSTSEDGISGGSFISVSPTSEIDPRVLVRFPHLIGLKALRIADADMALVPQILKGQIALSKLNSEGKSLDATSLQIAGVLDDLYRYDGSLGLTFNGSTIEFALWAPTATSVNLNFHQGPLSEDLRVVPMQWDNGVWRASADSADTKGTYYVYDVEVYVPGEGHLVHNIVTDPYSVALSPNSQRSYVLDLTDPTYKPAGWDTLQKPALAAMEDITIYELHIRDFSAMDSSVNEAYRGKYKAFSQEGNGTAHLRALQNAGLSHLHILPAFDIATIEENPDDRLEPNIDELNAAAPDSERQQELVNEVRDHDGYNWGYDPYHYSVPEGSYATNPEGGGRTLEFREMVASVNQMGLRLVLDVVYNHTSASGQNEKSVLDRIVPGYYHRRDNQGQIEHSTCCENTASEHLMMQKLMVDSLVLWAKYYKIDAFRFDLMGHHMVSNMQAIRAALDSLTPAQDGVDGSKIYLYGEGWNFGEVANGARGVNATQHNVGGLGIGTYSDRKRDAVRGGSPFDDGESLKNQGFANGLFYDSNGFPQGDERSTLLLLADRIRVELAGNLADYVFTDRNGVQIKGSQLDYNGQPSGYTQDPQELISYISKHDNQTLFDNNIYKAPLGTSMDDRIRIQIFGLSLVLFGQGVPFFHAGVDMLRSKSLDRDSYNSGDWFNRLFFDYSANNFGVGLPIAEKNQSNWEIMAPLLANPDLKPTSEEISHTAELFQEMLRIRKSSKLFRLETKQDVIDRVTFHNVGPDQIPGLIVMHISDAGSADLDPNAIGLMVLFNATTETQVLTSPDLANRKFDLHPIQANSVDDRVKSSAYHRSGSFSIPARTTAVFLESVPPTPLEVILTSLSAWEASGQLTSVQAAHLRQLGQRMAADKATYRSYFLLSVDRYITWGYLTQDQANILKEAAAEF